MIFPTGGPSKALFCFKLVLQLRERGLKSLALPLQRDSFLSLLKAKLRSLAGPGVMRFHVPRPDGGLHGARLRVIQAEASLGCLPSAVQTIATSESDRHGI